MSAHSFSLHALATLIKVDAATDSPKTPLSPTIAHVSAPSRGTTKETGVTQPFYMPPPPLVSSPPLSSEQERAFLEAPSLQATSSVQSSVRSSSSEADEGQSPLALPTTPASEPIEQFGGGSNSPAIYKTPQIPPLPFGGAEPVFDYSRTPLHLTSPRSEYDPSSSATAPNTPFFSAQSKNGYPASAPSTPAAWTIARAAAQQQGDASAKRFVPQRSRHRLSADIDNLLSQMNDMDFAVPSDDDDDGDERGASDEIAEVQKQIEEETVRSRSPLPLAIKPPRPKTTIDEMANALGSSMLNGMA